MTGKWTQSNWNQVLEAAAATALPGIGIMIEGQAVELAPYLTGRLKGSITYATSKTRSRARHPASGGDAVRAPSDPWTLYVGTNVDYAEYQEYGTRRMPTGNPFLRPALDIYRKPARQYYANAIKRAIAQYGK